MTQLVRTKSREAQLDDLLTAGMDPSEAEDIAQEEGEAPAPEMVKRSKVTLPDTGPEEYAPFGSRGNHEFITVYDHTGKGKAIQRNKIRHYLTKKDAVTGEPVFTARPRKELELPFGCLSTLSDPPCQKRFKNEFDQEDHFRLKHKREHSRRRERDTRDLREQEVEIQREQLNLMRKAYDAGEPIEPGGAVVEDVFEPEEEIGTAKVVDQSEQAPEEPDESWLVADIKDYIGEQGWEVPTLANKTAYLEYIAEQREEADE